MPVLEYQGSLTEEESGARREPVLRLLAASSFVCGLSSLAIWLLVLNDSQWIPYGADVVVFVSGLTALVLGWISLLDRKAPALVWRAMAIAGALLGLASVLFPLMLH